MVMAAHFVFYDRIAVDMAVIIWPKWSVTSMAVWPALDLKLLITTGLGHQTVAGWVATMATVIARAGDQVEQCPSCRLPTRPPIGPHRGDIRQFSSL